MKSTLSRILFLSSVIFGLDVYATADGPDYWAVQAVDQGDVLNIRQEPDPQSEKIGYIRNSQSMIINSGLTI